MKMKLTAELVLKKVDIRRVRGTPYVWSLIIMFKNNTKKTQRRGSYDPSLEA